MPRLHSDGFSETVANILAKHASHLLPLTRSGDCDREAAAILQDSPLESLFPSARHPEAALSGLMLLLGCWEESHQIAQEISSAEGSYWHAIVHRIEPDSANSGYWFRRVGRHAVFPELHQKASEILNRATETGWRLKPAWDPFLFIDWCEEARRKPGAARQQVAQEIQQVEWRLLFEWCSVKT